MRALRVARQELGLDRPSGTQQKPATLTKVDVDTNKGTVYLTGNVENATIKERATEIARQVAGVREVVNNLKIQ